VLAKCHMKKSEPHVDCFNYVRLASKRVVSPSRLSSRHPRLDALKTLHHLCLKSAEPSVEQSTACLVKYSVNLLRNQRIFLEIYKSSDLF
jgi:hypothetical protein